MLPRKYRYLLDTLNDPDDPNRTLLRFPMGRNQLRRKIGLPLPEPDHAHEQDALLHLRYRDPHGFALWLAYLAYEELVPLEGGYVLAQDLNRALKKVARPWLEAPSKEN